MDSNTHGAFIKLGEGCHAFMDGIPDQCEHDWNGDAVHFAASGKILFPIFFK